MADVWGGTSGGGCGAGEWRTTAVLLRIPMPVQQLPSVSLFRRTRPAESGDDRPQRRGAPVLACAAQGVDKRAIAHRVLEVVLRHAR
eukprot:358677-Chlamydomonas_euryale.AAC.2